jgi:ABC-type multidrug transport system ATPase subunit
MDEATRCDRVALIHGGRLLAVDTPADITRAFEWPLFGVRANERYKALLALRRYEHAHSVYPFGDVIHYADDRADRPDGIAADVTAFLKTSGFADASAEPLEPTVEDVFIDRTSEPRTLEPRTLESRTAEPRTTDPGSRIPDPGR